MNIPPLPALSKETRIYGYTYIRIWKNEHNSVTLKSSLTKIMSCTSTCHKDHV